ncbi:uncharacterized protein TNCV_3258211 [Trichonephila clavipes]|nr:uncharacterized protein TNCV_3258211 [Trichonephila clavipes]
MTHTSNEGTTETVLFAGMCARVRETLQGQNLLLLWSRMKFGCQTPNDNILRWYHQFETTGCLCKGKNGDRFNSCQVIYSQFGLAIHQNDHQARRRFVEWAQNEIAVVPDFHKRILFSDEAHFWLNDYVNKQNCRIWSEANPQVYVEKPLHPEKLTV